MRAASPGPSAPIRARGAVPPGVRLRYAAAVHAWMEVEGEAPQRIELRRSETTIGRGVSADLAIVHALVSRMHASVRRLAEGGYVVQDLGSSNGTWLEGERITRRVLKDGDVVQLGGEGGPVLVFHAGDEGHAPAPAPAEAAVPGRGHTMVWSALKPGTGGGAMVQSLSVPQAQAEEDPGRTAFFGGLDLRRRHLQLLVDGFGVQSFELSVFHPVKVGRDRVLNTVCLPHPSVSVEHAVVRVDDELRPVVEDLESTNGTFVNGEKVDGVRVLKEGDLLTFGTFRSRSLIFRDSAREELQVDAAQLVDGRLVIGRDPACTLVLNHVLISRHHAELRETADGFEIADLGSQNGTFVNEERVTRQRIQENDRIRIGPYQLVFHGGELRHQLDGAAIEVAVRDVRVDVDGPMGRLPILRGVSLVAGRREIVAIIGSSGSGKSTLLACVAGLVQTEAGEVLYNGAPLGEVRLEARERIGFVPQTDVLHEELTVEQCLEHAARLRLPRTTSGLERYEQVRRVLGILELEERASTPISQLSGGQKKRVSIGIELLSQPGVLLLDEPTAGLDPRTEERMTHLFRRIAGEGCTILLTTHLLGSFDLFDRVTVLAEGRLAFYGKPTEFYEHFDVNSPRDVYARLEGERTAEEWESGFAGTRFHDANVVQPLRALHAAPMPEAPPRLRGLGQAAALAARYAARKVGDRTGMAVLAIEGPVIGLLTLAVSGGVANAPRTLFISVIAALWFGCLAAVREVVDEWPIYRRERAVGVGIAPFLLSKLAVLLPIGLAQTSLLAGTLAAGGAVQGHLLPAIGLLFLLHSVGVATGLAVSCVARSAASALAAVPLLMIPQMLFAGLLVPVGEVPMLVPSTASELIESSQVSGEKLRALQERLGEGLSSGVGAAEIGAEGREELGRFTAVPSPSPIATAISTVMAARWGMEGLAHLYVHDPFVMGARGSDEYYPYQLANSLHFSLYTAAERQAVHDRLLAGRAEGDPGAARGRGLAYAGVLSCFLLVLLSICAALLRYRDREPMR